jgi:hypothetical protein
MTKEKNNLGNIILEVFKITLVISMSIVAYKWGALNNQDGSFNTQMSLFVIVPLFVIGRAVYNLYRNFKYRQRD